MFLWLSSFRRSTSSCTFSYSRLALSLSEVFSSICFTAISCPSLVNPHHTFMINTNSQIHTYHVNNCNSPKYSLLSFQQNHMTKEVTCTAIIFFLHKSWIWNCYTYSSKCSLSKDISLFPLDCVIYIRLVADGGTSTSCSAVRVHCRVGKCLKETQEISHANQTSLQKYFCNQRFH